ncbi:hypothetical protein N482_01770 [Pseudoalteromonas luteoviolacea NCIMB 1942]|uniref:Uncharacterized protein n=1 Tax=Pseudoalteromonas luteoviolacea NCIMB 1942 TaxID=1365253 RepID=A0A167CS16_9GAMM|nr:hypothetical protein N482_01770 [Pseudoalteromonas luteoviolacea NCIMB 1942]
MKHIAFASRRFTTMQLVNPLIVPDGCKVTSVTAN